VFCGVVSNVVEEILLSLICALVCVDNLSEMSAAAAALPRLT